MCLLIAICLALAYAALKPISDGLFDTSMWIAKVLAPVDSVDNETTKQVLKMGQSALMEGWLSNIPFMTGIVFLASIIVGFIHSWWGGILMYFTAAILGELMKLFLMRPVSYYLPLLYHKMVNRAADYKTQKDIERSQAAESFCKDLIHIMNIYQDCRLQPPTANQLKQVPYGDAYYWLEHGAINA